MAASTRAEGKVATPSTAIDKVTECDTVKAVTILTTGQTRFAHSTTARRKAMWS